MDLRKVQLTGGSSITVTLPKTWVEKTKLQPGDVVGCTQQSDGSLAIHAHAKGEREVQKYHVEVGDEESEYLFRKIIAAYLMGYDAIVVTSKRPLTPAARLAIRQGVRRIIGLEIVEEEPSSITVQDFLDPREFHMDKALRRMSMLTQAMQEEAFAALRDPNTEVLQSLKDRDDEVDRLYWLVNKQYHAMMRDVSYAAKMDLTASQALNFLLVARLIERTADHADRIAHQAVDLARTKGMDVFTTRLEKEGRRATELFRDSIQTFLKKDAKRANTIIDQANEFSKGQEKLLKDAAALSAEAMSHLAFIIESIGRTAAYAADISEVAINHKVAAAP
jgi:phosphate uptake regulator